MSRGEGDRGFTAALAFPDLADAREDVRLQLVEFLLVHLAELDLHLRRQQPLTEHRVVVHLRLDGGRDLVEDEPDPADEQ